MKNVYVFSSTNYRIFALNLNQPSEDASRICTGTCKNQTHLATPFPGVPPHHATTAWPLIMLPSTSSP